MFLRGISNTPPVQAQNYRKKGYKIHIHIDTLYLNYSSYSYSKYKHDIEKIIKNRYIGDSNNRSWYELEYARVGIYLDYFKAERSKQYHFVIQYKHSYLFNKKVEDLESIIKYPFSKNSEYYVIKRIDYNITLREEKHDFFDSGYISRHFRGMWTNIKGSTIYLGSRSSHKLVRIYDKTKELKEVKNAIKQEALEEVFDNDINNLITIELELQRNYIRERMDLIYKGTMLDYLCILHDARSIISDIEFFPYNDYNKKHYKSKNYNRIKDRKSISNLLKTKALINTKKYDPSIKKLAKRLNKIAKDYKENTKIKENKGELIREFAKLIKQESDGSINKTIKTIKKRKGIKN